MKIQTPTPKLNSVNNFRNLQNSTEQPLPQEKTGEGNKNVSFKGAEAFTMFLRFLENNQALGASVVDIGCMGIPRTTVDFTRGPDAGFETMRREFSSTADDALIGAFGMGAAYLLSQQINKNFNIKAHKMLMNDETLDILSHTWNDEKNLNGYWQKVLSNAQGFNPYHENKDPKGWVEIDNQTKENVIGRLKEEFKEGSNKSEEQIKETKHYIKALIADSTGAESKFKIKKEINKKAVESVTSLSDFVDNLYNTSKAFMRKEVADTFKADIKDNTFIKKMKGLNKWTAITGIGIATAIGCSLQPFNMYLTRKKTGKTGFVGVEGREPDKSTGFKVLKAIAAGAGGLAVMRSIGKFSEVMGKVQFKGIIPTIPQFKLVYGMTIVSRFLSARDKNELREATIKDTLGFVNWLILGGFVSKLVALGAEKMSRFKGEKFINYNPIENANQNGKSLPKWLSGTIITRDEVLHSALKKVGISTVKGNKAMTFREMMKEAKIHAPEAYKKVKFLSLIQLSGYLYSGLVLGIGIPKLNIAITKSIEKKRKEKAALNKEAA